MILRYAIITKNIVIMPPNECNIFGSMRTKSILLLDMRCWAIDIMHMSVEEKVYNCTKGEEIYVYDK